MDELRFTLLTDGPTDRALLPILTWLIQQHSSRPLQNNWAEKVSMRSSFAERIHTALELYPCELLFIHRDAESNAQNAHATRKQQIESAAVQICSPNQPYICVVPVRMTEAWLLFNEAAIRRAAGNPNGRMPLSLPPSKRIEQLNDPKETLKELLVTASGFSSGRRLDKFKAGLSEAPYRVSDLIDDYNPLRHLSAFQAMESDLTALLQRQNW